MGRYRRDRKKDCVVVLVVYRMPRRFGIRDHAMAEDYSGNPVDSNVEVPLRSKG